MNNVPISEPSSVSTTPLWRRWGRSFVRVLGSYGLACVILILLTLLTFLGTLEQGVSALFDVQNKYFESMFLVSRILGFPILLPGAYLLLGLLLVNLVVGGMMRLKRSWSRLGIFIIHLGVALLLIGGFIEFRYSTKGQISVMEGEPFVDRNKNSEYDKGEPFSDISGDKAWTAGALRNRFYDYFDWDLIVRRKSGDNVSEWVVPSEILVRAGDQNIDVPLKDAGVSLQIRSYRRNARIVRAIGNEGVDGFTLEQLKPHPSQAERNTPGCYVKVSPSGKGKPAQALISARQDRPFVFGDGADRVTIDIHRRSWALPFSVRLRKGIEKNYPGTSMPSEYSSYITKVENDVQQTMHITMNEPLRHRGYTLYQSGMNTRGNTRNGPLMESVFSVVKNPADKIPLIACIIILIGMLMQFGLKLIRYIRAEMRRGAANADGATA